MHDFPQSYCGDNGEGHIVFMIAYIFTAYGYIYTYIYLQITAFKRNRNLKQLTGSNCIENGKVKRAKNTFTIGNCSKIPKSKNTENPNAILACRHVQQQGHNFNNHSKFIIIDELANTSSSKETLRERLLQRENFWIQKLKTLVPYGLNQELSK